MRQVKAIEIKKCKDNKATDMVQTSIIDTHNQTGRPTQTLRQALGSEVRGVDKLYTLGQFYVSADYVPGHLWVLCGIVLICVQRWCQTVQILIIL
jgi:hypothetical protein